MPVLQWPTDRVQFSFATMLAITSVAGAVLGVASVAPVLVKFEDSVRAFAAYWRVRVDFLNQ